jgi:hypothetical protein
MAQYYQNGKCLKTLWLSNAQWKQRIKNIFWRNIHKDHISGDESSIEYDLQDCICERETGTDDVLIDSDEYKRLYKTAGVRNQKEVTA